MTTYAQLFQENHDTLALYTLALTRAHGKKHPEVFQVHDLFQAISDTDLHNQTYLNQLWKDMDRITKAYHVPQDTCPTYEKTYDILSQLSQAFHDDQEHVQELSS